MADNPDCCDTAAALSGLSVGWWTSRDHTSIWLCILPAQQRFVFLVERPQRLARRTLLRRAQSRLSASSPFKSKLTAPHNSWVCAFEACFSSVAGIDYLAPLIRAGRLVLEARQVLRREFHSLHAACEHYYNAEGGTVHTLSPEGLRDLASTSLVSPPYSPAARPAASPAAHSNLSVRLNAAATDCGQCVELLPSPHWSAFTHDTQLDPAPAAGSPTCASQAADATAAKAGAQLPAGDSTMEMLQFCQITAYWTDVRLPLALAPSIEGHERLLRLYESGLPAWAILLPACGFPYRPWFRTVTWVLFYAFSFFSLAVGFWDLYKALPGLQDVFERAVARLWAPPAAMLLWLEQHAQVRLSILLTYMFGKSELAVYIVRLAGHAGRVAQGALQPVLQLLGPPAALLRLTVGDTASAIAALTRTTAAPFIALFTTLWTGVAAVLLPVLRAAYSLVSLPVTWAALAVRSVQAACSLLWVALQQAGRGLALGTGVAKATVGVGAAVRGAATAPGPSSWLAWALPVETLRSTLLRVARAAQAVARFFTELGAAVVRHRLTLSRRATRAWLRARRRASASAAVPPPWMRPRLQRLGRAIQAALPGGGHGQLGGDQPGAGQGSGVDAALLRSEETKKTN